MKMKVVFSTLIAFVGVSSSTAFLSPIREQPLLPFRKGLRDSPVVAPQPPRGEVSVELFGGIFKKFKGDDDDEDGEKKVSTDSSEVDTVPELTNEENETTGTTKETEDQEAAPFFATVEEDVVEEDVEVGDETRSTGNDDEEAATVINELAVEVKTEAAREAADAETTPIEKTEEEVAAPIEPVAVVAETEAEDAETTPIDKKEEEVAAPIEPVAVVEESPMSQVEKLRAQAARVRLEADKQQVELTLDKIAKVNSKLERLKTQDTAASAKDRKSLEEELLLMKAQLTTDEQGDIKPVAPVRVAATSESSASSSVSKSNRGADDTPSLTQFEMDKRVKQFQEAPDFLKVLVAKTIGIDVDQDAPGAVERLNATDIVQKLHDDEIDYDSIASSDFADDSEQSKARQLIERAYKKSVKEQSEKKGGLFGLFGGDEEEGDIGRDGEKLDQDKAGTFSRLFGEEPKKGEKGESDLSFMMESMYPKSTRKEEETPERRQVDAFLTEVVAPTKAFNPSSEPISVPGGWMIRGTNACDSGGECIDKLDRRIDARLREKISFFLLKDPFPDQGGTNFDPLNWPQVLFVAGPNVARDSAPVLRTAISAVGIATVWYGSIAPFLANPNVLDRATNAVELADANMPTDLSFLSEMSIPLFLVFFALQLSHEAAHQAVAKARNFEATIPTFVPSIMSGITGSITSLKTSPKNRQELVEFAVAGPLTGMILSILVLCYGLILTATADPATLQIFPGLPLAILRQSTLGGGLVDIFLGNGVLNIPASSSEAAQALESTIISLHPLAVAGFVSLAVNALALVPAGRTDGGRITMALFGRSGSQGITFISLISLFILGVQSDLLLFYFAFIVFCQSELEIPMRDEIDNVDAPRAALALFAGFLMLLTLIPMT